MLTFVLYKALKSAIANCTTYKSIVRLLSSQKGWLRSLLVPFNEHVQLDFMSISEMENIPILHMVDLEFAFSVIVIFLSRKMEEV